MSTLRMPPRSLIEASLFLFDAVQHGAGEGRGTVVRRQRPDAPRPVRAGLALAVVTGATLLSSCSDQSSGPGSGAASGLSFGDVSAAFAHACGITTAGAYCWGRNIDGELGDGSTTSSSVPVRVTGELTFSAVTTGSADTCGLTSAGAPYCWGGNGNGQLGDGTTTPRLAPAAVSGGHTFVALTLGGLHTCGLTTTGAAYCWGGGSGWGATLGNGSTDGSLVPVAVSGGLQFSALSAGSFLTCGLTVGGDVYCWGEPNPFSGIHWTVPVAVSAGLTFTTISAGIAISAGEALPNLCGLATSGAAYCWYTNASTSVPVAVSGGLTFSALSNALLHTCALTASGTAYCWGENRVGELGNGSTTASSVPAVVTGGHTFARLSAGGLYTCGVTTGGVAYCWGSNDEGQLGIGTATGPELCGDSPLPCSTVPVKVAGQP